MAAEREGAAHDSARQDSAERHLFELAAGRWTAREPLTVALRQAEDYESPGLPTLRADTAYYRSRLPGESNFCLRRAQIDRERGRFVGVRVLIDPGIWHPTGTAVLNGFSVSPDGARVVTELARDGSETGELVVIDTDTGEHSPVPALRVRYAAVRWLPDSSGFRCAGRLGNAKEQTVLCHVSALGIVARAEPDVEPVSMPAKAIVDVAGGTRAAASVRMGDRVLSLHTEDGASVLTVRPELRTVGALAAPRRLHLGLDALMHVERFSAYTVAASPTSADPADDRHEAWIVASDPGTPPRLYRHDVGTGRTQAFGEESAADSTEIVHQRLVATMSDGAEVDLIVSARRHDLTRDGHPRAPSPLILTCYGGFGVSSGPAYEASLPAWTNQGGVFVTAQIRGGGEQGPAWHAAGSGASKLRCVTDLVECAEMLQRTGWCSPGSLCLMGASHGGLVVLAAALRRPGLCAAVAATAPLLDMTVFHREGFGARWLAEFGDPDDAADRERLLAYSPRHLLDALPPNTPLPAVLCSVFQADERVPPVRARAFVRDLRMRGGRAWLRTEAAAGHGAKPLDQVRRFSADLLGFAAAHTAACTPPEEER